MFWCFLNCVLVALIVWMFFTLKQSPWSVIYQGIPIPPLFFPLYIHSYTLFPAFFYSYRAMSSAFLPFFFTLFVPLPFPPKKKKHESSILRNGLDVSTCERTRREEEPPPSWLLSWGPICLNQLHHHPRIPSPLIILAFYPLGSPRVFTSHTKPVARQDPNRRQVVMRDTDKEMDG